VELVKSIVDGDGHPAMRDIFILSRPYDCTILYPQRSRIDMGTRRFSVFAAEQFNLLMMIKHLSSGRGTGFSRSVKIVSAYRTDKENLVKVTAFTAQESNCHRV